MEEMASLWSYQETMDEMRQKLMYTNLELEKLKVQTSEEMMKNKEYIKQLMQLLTKACQERDEARDQLQKLLNKINNISHVQVDSPILKATKANSSVTESNSLSETYNYQSHYSSPVESFFDAVSSPDFSNKNIADSNAEAYVNQPLVHENCLSQPAPKVDHASLVIDSSVKGKPLPQQGKFLQAVLEAGPLLQNLLVAGSLPQWRNPPQLKPYNIPPVSIKGCEAEIANQNLGANLYYPASRSLHSQPYFEMSCASSQMVSTPMLNFTNSASAGANMNKFVHLGKRQRFL